MGRSRSRGRRYETNAELAQDSNRCDDLWFFSYWFHSLPRGAMKDGSRKWDAAAAQAKSEAKVAVLGPPGDRIRDSIMRSFAKAFPDISLEFTGARGGELATKIKAERDAGIYSVDIIISGTSTADAYFKPIKALAPVEPALILPEVIDAKNWRDHRLEFSDRATRFDLVFATQNNVPLIYNPAQVKPEEVDQLDKILDPKWKGKTRGSRPNSLRYRKRGVSLAVACARPGKNQRLLSKNSRPGRRHR